MTVSGSSASCASRASRECLAEAPTVERYQRSKIGEVRVDGSQPGQKSLGESDGVVVVVVHVNPDESELWVGSGPLGEEHGFSGAGGCDDQRERTGERFVQSAPEGNTIDGVGGRKGWGGHRWLHLRLGNQCSKRGTTQGLHLLCRNQLLKHQLEQLSWPSKEVGP